MHINLLSIRWCILRIYFLSFVISVLCITIFPLIKIYGRNSIFLILTISSVIPLFFFKFTFFRNNSFFEKFLGHYSFYTNYFIIIILVIFILGILFSFFSLDFFQFLKKHKIFFNIFIVMLLAFLGIIGYKNYTQTYIQNYRITVSKFSNIKSLKVGFISDLHLSRTSSEKHLEKTFNLLKKQNIDILIIGGDLLDYDHKGLKIDIGKHLNLLKPKYGIFVTLGNHEYYGGVEENIKFLRGLNIHLLKDEIIDIHGIKLVGRDDRHNTFRKSLDKLLEQTTPSSPIIVLDHNPLSINESIDNNVDLHLSGHTHNGQFYPYNLIVKKLYLNANGYKKFENTNTIVSSGLGSWLIPYRIGSSSQIIIIDIDFL